MRRTIPLIATLAAMLMAAEPAGASTTDAIARDCQHSTTGQLTGTYTKAQLRKALHNLPSDVLEYSDCYDQINQALLSGGSGGGSHNGSNDGNGSGGTTGDTSTTPGSGTTDGTSGGDTATPPATPHAGKQQPVEIGGAVVQPGAIPSIGQDAHTLPTPLLIFLVLLGLGALVPLATTIVRRVIARRRA
jgi:hypothetical protein